MVEGSCLILARPPLTFPLALAFPVPVFTLIRAALGNQYPGERSSECAENPETRDDERYPERRHRKHGLRAVALRDGVPRALRQRAVQLT